MAALLGTIFCLFLCVTQALAVSTAKQITAEGVRIFVSLAQTDAEIARKLDASMAASIEALIQDLEKPQNLELFNQILRQESTMQAIFQPVLSSEFLAIQKLRKVYQAYEKRNAEILANKMFQLRNTEQVNLVREIFSLLPLSEANLLSIADPRADSKLLNHWRGIFRELIEYTHSYNRNLRIEVTRAFDEVSAGKAFTNASQRMQWLEYYNRVWSEVHPSNPNLVRSCYRVLSSN